jgi:hypothetical protein
VSAHWHDLSFFGVGESFVTFFGKIKASGALAQKDFACVSGKLLRNILGALNRRASAALHEKKIHNTDAEKKE